MLPAKWQHPWLRVSLVLRKALHGWWSKDAWRQIEPEIPKLLAEQNKIKRQDGSTE